MVDAMSFPAPPTPPVFSASFQASGQLTTRFGMHVSLIEFRMSSKFVSGLYQENYTPQYNYALETILLDEVIFLRNSAGYGVLPGHIVRCIAPWRRIPVL